jgi:hypothetical protein
LAVWFTLPRIDDQGTEVLQCLFAYLGLGAVANELGGCTAASDVFLECAEEFTIGFASVGVANLGLGTNIELGSG